MAKKSIEPLAPRVAKGRAVFLHRDSEGRHDASALQFTEWAAGYAYHNGLIFRGTREKMQDLIHRGGGADGDIFLDWDVSGNLLDRDALLAVLTEIERDRSISHVLIPRPDRLARPDKIEEAIALERRLRQQLGVTLVFQTRVCPPIPIGERMAAWELIQAVMDYEQAGVFRRELALKMLCSQRNLAEQGLSTGGRAPYGFQRCLLLADGNVDRPLRDGESVRGPGYHVVFMPREDHTFAIRRRIKQELLTKSSSMIARTLNAEGIVPPDAGRTRRDNGIVHKTLGVWNPTTITKIGNDSIDSGVVTHGMRSMGDQLRHGPKGPRPLVESDYRADKQPKVIQNPEEVWITAKAHFDPLFSAADQVTLSAVLKKRGATQRGKPRSRDPDNNPLGGRVFDIDCSWLMYRTPYGESYKYKCGAYMQSHGDLCNHNQINGPTLIEFVLSVIREKVLSQGCLTNLIAKLHALAKKESNISAKVSDPTGLEADLQSIRNDLDRAGDNLALAQSDGERDLIRRSMGRWISKEQELVACIDSLKGTLQATFNVQAEVAAAMKGLTTLTKLAETPNGGAAARELIAAVDAKFFLQFGDVNWGKRTVRRPVSGIVTFGGQRPPIQVYSGSTNRRSIKQAKKRDGSLVGCRHGGRRALRALGSPTSSH